MPLFEFRCLDCEKRFTFLAGVIADNDEAKCPRCGSEELKKLISRVARGRDDDARLDAMADKLENSDFDDEREVRKFAREMGREMGSETGEDMSDEIEAMIEAEARGEDMDSSGAGGFGGSSGDDGTIY